MRGWGALMHFSTASGQFRFKWCELYCCIRFSLSKSLLQILKTLGRFMCALTNTAYIVFISWCSDGCDG